MTFCMRARAWTSFAWIVAASGACGEMSEYETDTATSGIIGGVPIVPADESSFVALSGSTFCSGVLLSNEWVLTAASCNSAIGDTVTMGSQSRSVRWVIRNPDVASGVDVALVRLDTPMTMFGLTSFYRRQIATAPVSIGAAAACYGHGNDTFGGGAGTLRAADLTVADNSNNQYTFRPNASGQIMWSGDTGAPCLDSFGLIFSIHRFSSSDAAGIFAVGVMSSRFADWANGVVDGNWLYRALGPELGAPTALDDLNAFVHNGVRTLVYRRALDGHVIEVTFGTTPVVTDLSALAGGVVSWGAPFGLSESSTVKHVVFTSNRRVRKLRHDPVNGWQLEDLTALSGTFVNADGNPSMYMIGTTQNIIYRTTSGDISSLVKTAAGSWTALNITGTIGATTTLGDPAVYLHGGEQKIVYRNAASDIIEMWNLGSGWSHNNLGFSAGAPDAIGDPTGYSFGGYQHIIYRMAGGRVIELWGGAGGWNVHDMTTTTSAPIATSDPRGYANSALGKQNVVFATSVSNQGSIIQLNGNTSGSWSLENLRVESGMSSAPAPTSTPAALWITSTGAAHVYFRLTNNQVFELRTRD